MNLAVVGDTIVNYEYDHSGIRTAKLVDGIRTELINDTDSVIAELCQGEVTNYYRGLSLIGYEADDELYFYRLNAHGDTIGILDSFGKRVKTYSYDAFGNQESVDKFDTNLFRYCGEYFDNETGHIYLRARYYDPSIQRFISEDPICDSINWYAYCDNNPIIFIDSSGLATVAIREYTSGYGGTVIWNDTQGVATFQINDNTLGVSGSGYNAEGILVTNVDGRLYADDSDLNKFFFGITPADTQAGVKITMFGDSPYRDISIPVANALDRDVGDFEEKKGNNRYFASRVGNNGDWNLKYREADGNHWEETLGISFWGYQTQMLLNGRLVIVEQVGNITYGYLGAAAGMSRNWMNFGSTVNHIFKHGVFGWGNEFADQSLFSLGINWYKTGVMK